MQTNFANKESQVEIEDLQFENQKNFETVLFRPLAVKFINFAVRSVHPKFALSSHTKVCSNFAQLHPKVHRQFDTKKTCGYQAYFSGFSA